MIGAGSRLPAACLEKLQEISGAAAFFVVTQTAADTTPVRGREIVFKFTTAFLPSWAGGEKNSTSVARLLKKSFMKNNASFKQKRYVRILYSSDIINTVSDYYLINVETKRHEGDS